MNTRLYIILFTFVACKATTPVPPTPKPVDPTVVPCDAYCRHLRDELRCAAGANTKMGATCEEVCGSVQASGYVANRRQCSMDAKTCAEVDRCEE